VVCHGKAGRVQSCSLDRIVEAWLARIENGSSWHAAWLVSLGCGTERRGDTWISWIRLAACLGLVHGNQGSANRVGARNVTSSLAAWLVSLGRGVENSGLVRRSLSSRAAWLGLSNDKECSPAWRSKSYLSGLRLVGVRSIVLRPVQACGLANPGPVNPCMA